MTAPKPDEYGYFRVHAIDGSGLDFSTRTFDPEIHKLADGPASDYRGNPLPAAPAPEPDTKPAAKPGDKKE